MSTPKPEDRHFVTPNDRGRLAISNDQVSLKQHEEYVVENMCGAELRAVLNPRNCEYTLVINAPKKEHVFKVTKDSIDRVFADGNGMSWSPADVFTLFYTAKTFTITGLADLRKSKKGRATYESPKLITVTDAVYESNYCYFNQGQRYDISRLSLWMIRALERPLDCGYLLVLEHSTGTTSGVKITPIAWAEINIGLHNYDFMTITDIWHEEGK